MACSTIVATRPPGRDETRASFGSQVVLCKNEPPLKTRSGTATRSAACPAHFEENWRRARRAGTKAGAGAFPAPLHMKIWSEFKSCLRTDFRKAPPQKCDGAYPFRPTDNLTARCTGPKSKRSWRPCRCATRTRANWRVWTHIRATTDGVCRRRTTSKCRRVRRIRTSTTPTSKKHARDAEQTAAVGRFRNQKFSANGA